MNELQELLDSVEALLRLPVQQSISDVKKTRLLAALGII